jgi:aminoglycoside phosphotransferase (APT) family kinase protein
MGLQVISVQRDLPQTQSILQSWLEGRYPEGANPTVGQLQGFAQGYSGELLTFDWSYRRGGVDLTEGLVVRIEPSASYQLFLDTNFEEQYRVMEALWQTNATRLPRPVGFESNPDLLGARFYVMEKAAGATGQLGLEWMNAIGAEGLEKTWWNGLAAMAELHRADPQDHKLGFLDQPLRGSDPIDQQLHYYWEFYNWVREGESHPVIETAYDWLIRNKPVVLPPTGIVWGDAKRGNQLFGEDLECTVLLDFEMVCLGPAEVDLAWWLEGEHQTAEALGMELPPGVDETTKRYGELLGRDIVDIDYYLVFASFRLAVLRVKLYILLEGNPYRGGSHDGDKRLAKVLGRHAGVLTY